MIDVAACPNCGAPLRELVGGACPFCRAVLRLPDGVVVPERPTGVVLVGAGGNKIAVIKEVRRLTGWDLRQARALVDAASPATPQVVPVPAGTDEADALAALRSAGAVAEGPA